MHTRCNDPRASNYHNYGGRGIKVCERWDYLKYFVEDMGPRPTSAHTVDRINNDGNYEPSNCHWATKQEQARNRRKDRGYRNYHHYVDPNDPDDCIKALLCVAKNFRM